jgi:O-antigen/teichoic acid export membrane protein
MLKKIWSNELGRGTLILFIMINIYNFLNFLFHFTMGRMLGPEGYGILAVLMSLLYIYAIPSEAIQNIISKYTSKFNTKKEYGKIKFLLIKSFNKIAIVSIILFFILTLIAFFISSFLKINFWLIFIANFTIFFSISIPIIRGILQGRKKFSYLGINMIIESTLKLFFAISLVIFGFKVFGAIIGVLLGIFASLIFGLYFNKDILKKQEEKISFPGIYSQSIPYFVVMVVIFLSFSLDIILAKRFFSPELAGQYSVLSMLGKMIFFGTVAISKAMFPLTSEKQNNNEDSLKLFKRSMLIITFICIWAILIYGFFPELIISILYGNQYIKMAPYLIYSILSLSFLSLSNLVLIYGLSTNKIRKTYYLFIFLILEIILLSLFHHNILEYILAFMVSNIIMFIGSLFFIKKWD